MKLRCAFGDTVLTDRWMVTNIVRPKPRKVVSTETINGRDGVIVTGSRYESYNVTMDIWIYKPYMEQEEELLHLASIFNVSEPTRLWFSDDYERYRLAIPNNEMTIVRHMDSARVSVSFLIPEPAMYGSEVTFNTTTGVESEMIHIDGTYPTQLLAIFERGIEKSLHNNRSDLQCGFALYDDSTKKSNRILFNIPGAFTSFQNNKTYHRANFFVDMVNRVASVENLSIVDGKPHKYLIIPSPDSEWFSISPGVYEFFEIGDFAANRRGFYLKWTERWI